MPAFCVWRVLRFGQWWYFAPLPLAGLVAPGVRAPLAPAALLRHTLLCGVAGLLLAFAYGLNAITDRRTDSDPAKNPLAGALRVPLAASAVVLGTAVGALGLAWVLDPLAAAAAGCSLAAAVLYSAGPRLKRFPLLGLLANLAIFAPLPFLGLSQFAPRPPLFDALVGVFLVLLTQNQLLHELADAPDDARAGDRTTARWLGARRTSALLGVLGAAGVGLALAWATTPAEGVVGATLAAAGTAVALWPGAAPLRRRRQHRLVSLAGGTAYVLGVVACS